jgi:hypothetical protein
MSLYRFPDAGVLEAPLRTALERHLLGSFGDFALSMLAGKTVWGAAVSWWLKSVVVLKDECYPLHSSLTQSILALAVECGGGDEVVSEDGTSILKTDKLFSRED